MDDAEKAQNSEAIVPYNSTGSEVRQSSLQDSIREWVREDDQEIHIDPCPEHPKRTPFAIIGRGNTSERVYFIANPVTGNAEMRAKMNFYSPDFWQKSALIRKKESGDNTGINFYNNGLIGLTERINGRYLRIDYSQEGELIHFEYELDFSDTDESENETRSMFTGIEIYSDNAKKLIETGRLNIEDFYTAIDLKDNEISFVNEDGRVHFVRREDGKIIDEAFIPGKVDVDDLQTKFSPHPLLKNPRMIDDTYDVDWKTLDPMHEAGIRWDALENDKFNSLSRSAISIEETP